MRDWIGTGQRNSLPLPFEVGFFLCYLTSLFTGTPFQCPSTLTIQTLFGSITSYYKQPLAQTETAGPLQVKGNEHQHIESKE